MRLALLLCLITGTALAQTPDSVAYQGFLTDPDGTPINEIVELTLHLYWSDGSPTGWSETHPAVTVEDGVFDVILGSQTPLADSLFARPLLLGIAVGDDPETLPRTSLAAMPYALSRAPDASAVPRIITHQGLLVDDAGVPVSDDSLTVHFSIYEQSEDGVSVWDETQRVGLNSGVFSAYLGSVELLDIPFDRPYWLGVRVDGETEMTPRTPLAAAPYALNPCADELCDGVDNDLDGRTDEGYSNLGQACVVGIGGCSASGVFVCSTDGLSTECNATEGTSTEEVCDGVDNNCNGQTDETFLDLGDPCVAGVGACEAIGTMTCSTDGLGTVCNAVLGTSTSEVCDGIDNDCNGQIDETFPTLGEICRVGIGGCESQGTFVCAADGNDVDCSATEGTPTEEVCDGIDNDCNFQVDDGLLNPPLCPEQRGVCNGAVHICLGAEQGWWQCYSDDGYVRVNTYGPDYRLEEDPVAEPGLCDTLDNDCDGTVDEGCP